MLAGKQDRTRNSTAQGSSVFHVPGSEWRLLEGTGGTCPWCIRVLLGSAHGPACLGPGGDTALESESRGTCTGPGSQCHHSSLGSATKHVRPLSAHLASAFWPQFLQQQNQDHERAFHVPLGVVQTCDAITRTRAFPWGSPLHSTPVFRVSLLHACCRGSGLHDLC